MTEIKFILNFVSTHRPPPPRARIYAEGGGGDGGPDNPKLKTELEYPSHPPPEKNSEFAHAPVLFFFNLFKGMCGHFLHVNIS